MPADSCTKICIYTSICHVFFNAEYVEYSRRIFLGTVFIFVGTSAMMKTKPFRVNIIWLYLKGSLALFLLLLAYIFPIYPPPPPPRSVQCFAISLSFIKIMTYLLAINSILSPHHSFLSPPIAPPPPTNSAVWQAKFPRNTLTLKLLVSTCT